LPCAFQENLFSEEDGKIDDDISTSQSQAAAQQPRQMLTLGCTHTPQPTTNRKLSCFFPFLRPSASCPTVAHFRPSTRIYRPSKTHSLTLSVRSFATRHRNPARRRPGRKFDSSGKGTIEERKDGGLACASPDFRGQYVFPPSSLQFPSFVGNIERRFTGC
jgi:hypothetical protein